MRHVTAVRGVLELIGVLAILDVFAASVRAPARPAAPPHLPVAHRSGLLAGAVSGTAVSLPRQAEGGAIPRAVADAACVEGRGHTVC